MKSSSVKVPTLSSVVVANLEGDLTIVYVSVSVDIHALLTKSSKVSDSSTEVLNLLIRLISPWSKNSKLSSSESLSVSNRDSIVSSGQGSNGFSS